MTEIEYTTPTMESLNSHSSDEIKRFKTKLDESIRKSNIAYQFVQYKELEN